MNRGEGDRGGGAFDGGWGLWGRVMKGGRGGEAREGRVGWRGYCQVDKEKGCFEVYHLTLK